MLKTLESLAPYSRAAMIDGAAIALFLAMFAVWCIIGARPV